MLQIGSIVWGVRDITNFEAVWKFWCEALNYKPASEPGADWVILNSKDGNRPQMAISVVSAVDAGLHNRTHHHLDLYASNQQNEIHRLQSIGATRPEREYPNDADYIILEDPDGNAFCVIEKA